MRGTDEAAGSLFSYVDLEERIPASLDADFDRLYSAEGRPSIAPERLMRASLVQILFSVRSERQLMEQMQYNLLLRWFVGLGIDDPVWVPTVFTKNRDRLLTTDMSRKFLAAILAHREVEPLLSDEHFSVDGTLVKAWASMKSFQPKGDDAPPDDDGGPDNPPAVSPDDAPDQSHPETAPMTRPARHNRNAEVDFRGEKRSNATHASTTDPDARLFKKSPGTGAMLCFMGHTLMENRSGLIVQADLIRADGHAERREALDMIHRHSPGSTRRLTLGPTRDTTARILSPNSGKPASPLMSPESSAIPPSPAAPPATPVTPCRRNAERRSRSPSDGPRPSAAWPRRSIAASSASAPGSP